MTRALVDAVDREAGSRLARELMWVMVLTAHVGTVDLLADADSAVAEAFARFCRERDGGPPSRGPRTPLTVARTSTLTMAGLFRIATDVVLADDLATATARFCELTSPRWSTRIGWALTRPETRGADRVIAAFAKHGGPTHPR